MSSVLQTNKHLLPLSVALLQSPLYATISLPLLSVLVSQPTAIFLTNDNKKTPALATKLFANRTKCSLQCFLQSNTGHNCKLSPWRKTTQSFFVNSQNFFALFAAKRLIFFGIYGTIIYATEYGSLV